MITFDSFMLKTFVAQETDFFVGARINKIQQPTRREIIFNMRNNGETRQFYININPRFYHVCFISDENVQKRGIQIPQKPPMFCMLLRKYLSNARIAKVIQHDDDRILELYFESFNELGDKIYLCLAIELMGKYSNVILYNSDTGIIIGSAHNVGTDKSIVREVYGTIPYVYPPCRQDNKFLSARYGFLSSCNKMDYLGKNANEIIDNYYSFLIEKDLFKFLKNTCIVTLTHQLKKVDKSLSEMHCQCAKYEETQKYRLWGDLIMANLFNLTDYSSDCRVFDYENNCYIDIVLDKEKTLKDNANNYYKKYNKGKKAKEKLKELIESNKLQKDYLESILFSVDIAQNINELKEIEQEVMSLNSEKNTSDNNKRANSVSLNKFTLICIEKSSQTRIYIGKNNKQNDYIVSKLASDEDLWFHTKDCPGSHVLLKTQNLTNDLILECAKLAKENSKGADSSKVGVIYTKRKYLRKPPKANPGYVTYKNEKEIIL